MVYLSSLWLPIVLSAVGVFIVSSISHMVLKLHAKDYERLADESAVLEAMRQAGVKPGNYYFPHCIDMKEMATPEMQAKYQHGPVGFMNVTPSGPPAMGKSLGLWFVYSLIVSLFVAYLTGRTVPAGAEYLAAFRVAGATAFLAYGVANIVDSVWKAQAWGTTFRHMIDGLAYALVTAGVFGWHWTTL